LATQNPIETEGTYALPEAQVDRFMLKVIVGYPDKGEELKIMDLMTGEKAPEPDKVIEPADIAKAREAVRSIYIDPKIKQYIVDIVFATREPGGYGLEELQDLISYGASPRASIYLNLAAKAHAFLRHRGYVTPEDVKAIGPDVLRHRVIVTYEAEAEQVTSADVVSRIFDHVEVP
jgi:MoxR-like ATPase